MKVSTTLTLVAALIATGTGTAMAGMSSSYADQRREQAQMGDQTIGALLASGQVSEQQVTQLIQFTGLNVDSAKEYTIPEVVGMRWTNN